MLDERVDTLNDGSFGITGDCKDINAEEVEALENHKFEISEHYFGEIQIKL